MAPVGLLDDMLLHSSEVAPWESSLTCHTARMSTSFFIDCGMYGTAPARVPFFPEKMAAKRSRFEPIIQTMYQRIKGKPMATLPFATYEKALDVCSADPYCVAFCRSEQGVVRFHKRRLNPKMVDGERHDKDAQTEAAVADQDGGKPPKKDWNKGPWQCYALKEEKPLQWVQLRKTKDCLMSLQRASHNVWSPERVIKKEIVTSEGKKLHLLQPEFEEFKAADPSGSMEELKIKCAEDDHCDALCFNKENGRELLYSKVEQALSEPNINGDWRKLLLSTTDLDRPNAKWLKFHEPQKDKDEPDDTQELKAMKEVSNQTMTGNWNCMLLPKKCRHEVHEVAKTHQKNVVDHVLKTAADKQGERQETSDSFQWRPSPGYGTWLRVDDWGGAGMPEADKTEVCNRCSAQFMRRTVVKQLPSGKACREHFLAMTPPAQWFDCCAKSQDPDDEVTCQPLSEYAGACKNCTGPTKRCLTPKSQRNGGKCTDVGTPEDLQPVEKGPQVLYLERSVPWFIAAFVESLPPTNKRHLSGFL